MGFRVQRFCFRQLLVPLIGLCRDAMKGTVATSASIYSMSSLLHLSAFATADGSPAAAAATPAAAAVIGRESLECLLCQAGCAEVLRPRESVIYHLMYCLLLAANPPPYVSFRCLCSSTCRSTQRRLPPFSAAAAAHELSDPSSSSSNEAETEELWKLTLRLVSVSVSRPKQPLSLLWVFCLLTALDRVKPAKEHLIASKRVNRNPHSLQPYALNLRPQALNNQPMAFFILKSPGQGQHVWYCCRFTGSTPQRSRQLPNSTP